jgi:hypothetical protein
MQYIASEPSAAFRASLESKKIEGVSAVQDGTGQSINLPDRSAGVVPVGRKRGSGCKGGGMRDEG